MTAPSPIIQTTRQLTLDLDRPSSYSREDFVVSACNRAAVAAMDSWPLWPGGRMALVGPPGCGKTHLARAWASKVGAITPQDAIPLASARAVLVEDADLSVAEDALFHLINMADTGATLLITGRTEPSTWRTGLADLRSRLNALTVAHIEAPDDVVLQGVMEKLFGERNIRPRKDVYTYILRRIERSVPAVQDLVKEIDEFAGAQKCEVTRALVSRILRNAEGTLGRGR